MSDTRRKRAVSIDGCCDICGDGLTLHTNVKQPTTESGDTWAATVDDVATCDGCGEIHYVHGDEGDGWLGAAEP